MSSKLDKKYTKYNHNNWNHGKNEQVFTPDETDKKILNIVVKDARLSYREIARQSSLAVKTVIDRIRRLEAEGVIKSYSANLDSEKLGYTITAVIEMIITRGLIRKKTFAELSKYPNVFIVYEITGVSDTVIVAKFKDTREMERFLRELQSKEFVQKTETKIVINSVKEDFRVEV